MIANLLRNWKTTSAGLLMVLGSIVHLVFAIKGHVADENTWMASFVGMLGGAGLLFAGDSNVPSATSIKTAQAIDQINQQGPNPMAPPIAPPTIKP